jgi:hypothetical protein
MHIIHVDGTISIRNLDAAPDHKELHTAIGGYLELIPYLNNYKGQRCIAYCDEDGKMKGKPLNITACNLWDAALKGRSRAGDFLVGTIVILTGDREFMEAQ